MSEPFPLTILCCPETHQELRPAQPALVEKVNQHIAAGRLRNRSGQPVTEKIDGGYVRQDGTLLYPIREDVPLLLPDEALPLASL